MAASAAVARQDEEESEEEAARLAADSLRERTERARLEREEKERRYVEVRARLFGENQGTKEKQSEGQGMIAGAGARRSGRRGGDGRGGPNAASASTSSADQSPARGSVTQRTEAYEKQASSKVLYDPTYQPKPGSFSIQRRDGSAEPGQQQQPIRQPQGPDSSGRGGFAFAGGGGRGSLGKT